MALREEKVNWDQIRQFMHIEDVDPNQTDIDTGVSTLHMASYDGHLDIVRWCIRKQGDVNARSVLGRAPLHHACDGNRTSIMRVLLEVRADVNIRTLSQLTPLHLLCQSNNLDAVLVLLGVDQTVDVDAEDSKRRIPEATTTNKSIKRAIRKYRSTLDEKRKTEMVDECLRRLFNLFRPPELQYIQSEAFLETQALLAQHFEMHDSECMEHLFAEIDTNKDGRIDWNEFRAAHQQLLKAIGAPFQDLSACLSSIETALVKEKVGQRESENIRPISPMLQSTAKKVYKQRTSGSTLTLPPIDGIEKVPRPPTTPHVDKISRPPMTPVTTMTPKAPMTPRAPMTPMAPRAPMTPRSTMTPKSQMRQRSKVLM